MPKIYKNLNKIFLSSFIILLLPICLSFVFTKNIAAVAKEFNNRIYAYDKMGFALPSVLEKNQYFKLTNLAGKKFLLSFFTVGCKKCENNYKYFSDLVDKSIPVYGIFCENKNNMLDNDFSSMKNIYKDIALDTGGIVSDKWLLVGAPETFLINENGIIVKRIKGSINSEIYRKEILPFFDKS
ncbi:MAG: redoxin domain-containing protein [Alphaproteobacteria bacterium]